tara:strand:+ start:270 stop:467 length:198 start_codon:yes stop_codon:yes gene_type:complete
VRLGGLVEAVVVVTSLAIKVLLAGAMEVAEILVMELALENMGILIPEAVAVQDMALLQETVVQVS